ncbi:MAG: RluA family pseudouridine synthase [Nitrospirota bacterium]
MSLQENTARFPITPEYVHTRIDHFLVKQDIGISRTYIQRLIKDGHVLVNNKSVKSNYRLRLNDEIVVIVPPPTELEIVPENIPLDIIYEDSSIIVINKPAGMVVHPAAGNYSGTIVNALLYHCKDLTGIGGKERPGIVHRLDKDTSGLLVAAKDDHSQQHLSHQFKKRTIEKRYLALVAGVVKKESGTIEIPIGRDIKDRKKISPTTKRARTAITHFKVAERFKNASLLEIKIETGRTHQIRVHLADFKHPVLGDIQYGGKNMRSWDNIHIARQMLHAERLGIIHPVTERFMEFKAEIPGDMKRVRTLLRRLNRS